MRPPPTDKYFVGVDLGQMQDYTALTVIKKAMKEGLEPVRQHYIVSYEPKWLFHQYQIVYLERLPLGTPYPEQVRRIKQLTEKPPLKQASTHVAVDVTGAGLPVYQELKKAGVKNLHGIHIHDGDAVTAGPAGYRVPKRDLVAAVLVLLQNDQLVWNKDLPQEAVLYAELQNLRVEINPETGHDSYSAWRERDHDDLVLSLSCAVWFAENGLKNDWSDVKPIYNRF